MKRFQIFLLFLCMVATFSSHAQRGRVIYGKDDRIDPYLVQDAQLLELTKSTVAVVRRSSLVSARLGNQNLYQLKTRHYGQTYGLCTNERFFDQPLGAFCSGSLIAPNLILTAGHCIEDTSVCSKTSFVFNFSMKSENETATTFEAEDVVHCKKVITSIVNNNGEDFAIIEIDRPVTHVEPLKLSSNANLKVGTPLVVIGHPSGLPVKIASGGKVRNLMGNTGYFTTNLDTYGGNSGSAVFNIETGEIEGVLVRGEVDFVRQGNCKTSKVCTEDGCRGEDVTKASFVKQKVQHYLRSRGQQNRNPSSGNGRYQNQRSRN